MSSFTSYYNPKYNRKGDEPYPSLDVTTHPNRKIWIVKVPKFVCEQWKSAVEGSILAKMAIREDKTAPTPLDISIKLPLLEETQDLPREFKLHVINTQVANSFVFSDSKQGYAQAVQGKVEYQAVMVPCINPEYHKMNKQRTQRAAVHQKQTKMVEKDELARNLGLGFAVSSQDSIFAKKYLKQKQQEVRKERMPQAQLIQNLIYLFQEYPYWSLKGLTERTNQSQMYIKEVLPSVGKLNKRGPYAGMYSLRPELNASDAPPPAPEPSTETSMEVDPLVTEASPPESTMDDHP